VVERKRVFDSVSYELEHYNPAYVAHCAAVMPGLKFRRTNRIGGSG
jgi:hypothetical protein